MTAKKTARMNLKLFRVEKGLTQSEMAAAIGCARPTYSLIEEGTRGGRFEFWNSIQQTFDVPSEKMFELMKCGKE